MNDTMIDRVESASYDPEPEPPMTTEEKNAPKIPPARLNWKVGATFSPPETGRELREVIDDFLCEVDERFQGIYETVPLTEKIYKLFKKI